MYNIIEVSSDTNIGGAGKCILTLASNYDKDIFNMAVILPKKSLLKPHLDSMGVEVIEVDGISDKSLDLGAIRKLKRIFKERRPDIVHTHASMSARIAAKLSHTNVIYTRHSVFEPSKKISTGLGKVINGAVNNYFSDAIIAVAEAAKDNLTDTGVDERNISVILNGVSGLEKVSDDEKLAIRTRFNVADDEKVVSIIARLEDIKGHEYFIEAADIIKKQGVKAKFIIAGTGSYEDVLKEKVRMMGLEDTVLFTGFIKDVDKLLNITDIQANASYGTEATSLSLLEGMSLGVPAVVSDFGGNSGVIKSGENGFVVPKKNSDALAKGIYELLTDNAEYEKMKRKSVEIFNSTFTAEAMTRNTEKLYIEVIGGQKNG